MRYDTIVVGAGLAGACAACVLSRTRRVLVLEAEALASGASGAAAGLVNPLMGRKARPSWRHAEALHALHALLDDAGATRLFRATSILRPARDAKQADRFREVAARHPADGRWQPAAAVADSHPAVRAPHGALLVTRGGHVDVAALVHALLEKARGRGAQLRTGSRVTSWAEDRDAAAVITDEGERLQSERVLLALGQGYPPFDELAALGLHGVKGQTVRLQAPDGLTLKVALSGYGYVVPEANEKGNAATLVVGSSYEHAFDDLRATPEVSEKLVAKAARMVPALEGVAVLDAMTGVRVKVARGRHPVLGPLPGRQRVWAFTGLGSRGLLTAPLLAERLPHFLAEPAAIPDAVQPRRAPEA